MNVIKITPRGYCHGVVSALQIVANVLGNPNTKQPIFLLGEIVHNQNITEALTDRGIITLQGASREEMLAEVSSGTVIVTAHGIAPNLIEIAKDKGLDVIDATCSDVYKTHDVIREKISSGYQVLYIGKQNHPEPEGAIGISPENISLISSIDDLHMVNIHRDKLCITNQTTMSVWDTAKIMEEASKLYPHIEIINEICDSTSMRQQAVSEMASLCDLVIVVGDPKSNNTNRLVQIAEEVAGIPGIRINTVEDLDLELLSKYKTVGVTSGASTPTLITSEVIDFLTQFKHTDSNTHDNKSKVNKSRIIPRNKH